jgi:curved DNA-binding protein CbpA
MKDYYAILGVTPTATLEEIEAAYRQKAKQYHPDKVSHLGPEFQELAERKMKEINEAYEALIKLRGGTQYRRYKQSASEQHEKTTENKTAPGTAQDVKTPEAEVVKTKTRLRKSTIILMLLVFLAGFWAVVSLNRVENLAQQLSALEHTQEERKRWETTLAGNVYQIRSDLDKFRQESRNPPSIALSSISQPSKVQLEQVSQRVDNLASEVRQLAQKVSALERTPKKEQDRIVTSEKVQPTQQTKQVSKISEELQQLQLIQNQLIQQINNLVNEAEKLAQRVTVLEQAQQELKKPREQEKQQTPSLTTERTKATSVDIGDGFLLSNAYFTSDDGKLKLMGQITNNSQLSYFLPEFEIRIYDSNGKFIRGQTFTIVGDLPSKKTRSFEVLLYDIPANTKVGKYEIQFVGD